MAVERDTRLWTGWGKLITAFIVSTLFLAMITLGVSLTHATQLGKAPVDRDKLLSSDSDLISWSWFVYTLFYGLMPGTTIIYCTFELMVHIFGVLHPICNIIFSIMILIAWVVNTGFWIHCDFVESQESAEPGNCSQSYAKHLPDGSIENVSQSLTNATVALNILFVIIYLVRTTLAGAAIYRRQRSKPGEKYTPRQKYTPVQHSYA